MVWLNHSQSWVVYDIVLEKITVARCPSTDVASGQVAGPMELDTHWLRPHLRESTGIEQCSKPLLNFWVMIEVFLSKEKLGMITWSQSIVREIRSYPACYHVLKGRKSPVTSRLRQPKVATRQQSKPYNVTWRRQSQIHLGTGTIAPLSSFWIWGDPISMGMLNVYEDLIDGIYITNWDMMGYIYIYI